MISPTEMSFPHSEYTQGKKEFVRQIFAEITPRYDRLNRLMSCNLDQRWRSRAVASLVGATHVADLCAGTGDMALALLANANFKGKVVLVDFCPEMLAKAKEKLSKTGYSKRTEIVKADTEALPFTDQSFDGVISGFALRNLENLDAFFHEAKRILKPGSLAVFLEIAHPESILMRSLFHSYFYYLLPGITRIAGGNGQAYSWLPESLKRLPRQKDLVAIVNRAGYRECKYQNFTGGMVACYQAVK